MIDASVLGHVFFVQFVTALFVVSMLAYFVSVFAEKYIIKYQSRLLGRWSLWFAVVMLLVSVIFGLYAYSVVKHDDLSHYLLMSHRNIALISGIVGVILSIWSMILFKKDEEEGVVFVFLHFCLTLVLIYVTWMGILLSHQFGVGVERLPDYQSHDHLLFDSTKSDDDPFQIDLLFESK